MNLFNNKEVEVNDNVSGNRTFSEIVIDKLDDDFKNVQEKDDNIHRAEIHIP